eukprot:768749-Hanusia_phi.AAC.18
MATLLTWECQAVTEVRRTEESLQRHVETAQHEDADVKSGKISITMAKNYYKLLAIKDEFEVARLLLDGSLEREISRKIAGYGHVREEGATKAEERYERGRWEGEGGGRIRAKKGTGRE